MKKNNKKKCQILFLNKNLRKSKIGIVFILRFNYQLKTYVIEALLLLVLKAYYLFSSHGKVKELHLRNTQLFL